jgi:ribosomal protein L16 Arg81 hydroxylase
VTRTERDSTSSALASANGRVEELDAYRWVIDPMTPDEFQSKYYEKGVCLIRRGAPAYFSGLLSIDHLDRILTTGLVKYPEISLVQNEKNIRSEEYVDADDDRVDPIRATRLFRQGATIIFTHLHQRLPSLGRLCEGLARRFASRMQTNIYLTPPSAQGFAPHWDTHDVFILQVAGTKRWSIYDTKIPLPLRGQYFDRTLHEPGPVSMEFDLEPGDVCYLPRGAIHSAVSSTDTSLHITTGLIAYTWIDLLLQAVVAAGIDDVSLRENLPMGWPALVDEPQLAREYTARVQRLVAHLHSAAPPFSVLGESISEEYSSLSAGLLKRAILANELTLASVVRIRPDAESELSENGEQCAVRSGAKEFEMPAAALPALKVLEAQGTIAIGALPDSLDDESKLVLVRRLLAEGIVDGVE